jgi:hypothetical protein
MSNQNAREKSKYESPILVPLGEMAKGAGACTAGSGYLGACVYNPGGNAPYTDPGNCTAGTLPNGYCSAGTTATILAASYCSAGTTASDYCTAGNCAPGPAGYCTSSGVDAGAACTTSGTTAGS